MRIRLWLNINWIKLTRCLLYYLKFPAGVYYNKAGTAFLRVIIVYTYGILMLN